MEYGVGFGVRVRTRESFITLGPVGPYPLTTPWSSVIESVSFLFFFCYAIWRCFGEIGSSVQFFCISDKFSYCVSVFFTQRAHIWTCGAYLNMRGTFQPHILERSMKDSKRVSHSFYNVQYTACGFHLLCLNMIGRQGDQDLHPEVQLDVGCCFESHSSVGYWLHTVLH